MSQAKLRHQLLHAVLPLLKFGHFGRRLPKSLDRGLVLLKERLRKSLDRRLQLLVFTHLGRRLPKSLDRGSVLSEERLRKSLDRRLQLLVFGLLGRRLPKSLDRGLVLSKERLRKSLGPALEYASALQRARKPPVSSASSPIPQIRSLSHFDCNHTRLDNPGKLEKQILPLLSRHDRNNPYFRAAHYLHASRQNADKSYETSSRRHSRRIIDDSTSCRKDRPPRTAWLTQIQVPQGHTIIQESP